MTLLAFMSALKTEGVKVTLIDSDGKEIIKFYSNGYAGVESEILALTVKKFELPANNTLNITLNDAPSGSGTSSSTPYNP
jgi:hypothetical protein